MLGHQRLVGGDHVLARPKRRLDRLLGNAVGAADQLDEHIDAGILGQGDRIVEPFDAGRVDAAVLALVACRYPNQFDRPAGALSEARFMRVKQVEQASADGAKAGDAQGERFLHGIARS